MAQTIDIFKLALKPQYWSTKKKAAAIAACKPSSPKFVVGGCGVWTILVSARLCHIFERGRPARRTRRLTAGLRTGFRWLTPGEPVKYLFQQLRRQVFVCVFKDLHHRRIGTRSQALDFFPTELTVGREMMRVMMDAGFARLDQLVGTAQQTRRRAAHLHVGFFADSQPGS